MKKQWWSRQHAIGLAIGIITTLIFIPIVAIITQKFQGEVRLFSEVRILSDKQVKTMYLAAIPNLFWFHYFLKKELYPFGYGIIYATVLNLLATIVVKFFF
jgi:hypothetical protein